MLLFLRLITLASVLATTLVARPALAQDGDAEDIARARTHFDAGTQYYAADRFDDAAREFEEAYRLTGHPDVLYNLAQSYDRLERYDEAIQAYRSYLETAGDDARERGRVDRRVRELETLRDAQSEGGADGTETTGTTETTDSGEADVYAAPPPRTSIGTLTWVTLGVGAASTIAAIAFGVTASGIHSDLTDRCTPTCAPGDDPSDDKSRGATFATMADVFGIAGALLLAGGIVLLAMDLTGGDDETNTASLEITNGPTPLGAGARLRF